MFLGFGLPAGFAAEAVDSYREDEEGDDGNDWIQDPLFVEEIQCVLDRRWSIGRVEKAENRVEENGDCKVEDKAPRHDVGSGAELARLRGCEVAVV